MRLFSRKRTGFLTRLSNIIIIQVLFVFVALTIVIFYPEHNNSVDSEYVFMREKLHQAGNQIAVILGDSLTGGGEISRDNAVYLKLAKTVDIDNVIQSYLYVCSKDNRLKRLFSFRSSTQTESDDVDAFDLDDMVDTTVIQHHVALADGLVIPIIYSSRFFVYYYQIEPENSAPVVLVAISDHHNNLAGSDQVRYTFLMLFLASALVSFLTVYLINKRFQEPLERLIDGFQKTVKGELFSLVETDMDDELSNLAKAYNDMSLTLWGNNKKLSDYNARLEDANEMLAESQEFLGTLIDSSPGCIISASPDGEIMLFNRKAAEVFGVERQEIIGKNIDTLFTHRLSEIKTSKAIIGDNHSMEVLCRRGDSSLFPAYLITAPVDASDGEIWAYLYLVKDISESKNFQEMMVRLDRYYTRGEMAGDIAHEINNFLAILSGNVELMPLLMKKGDQGKISQKLEVMKNTVDRIAQFTDGLMDSNEDEVRFEMVDVNQLVETVIAFLKPQNRFDRIDVKTDLSTDIPLVELDSGQIEQLLVNLLYNAADALEEQGDARSITIKTELNEQGEPKRIALKVIDNGPGVLPEKEQLLFRKRFTTKRRGHGIGLITCQRIVDTHDGRISYEKADGAVFAVELPVIKRAEQSEAENTSDRQIAAVNV